MARSAPTVSHAETLARAHLGESTRQGALGRSSPHSVTNRRGNNAPSGFKTLPEPQPQWRSGACGCPGGGILPPWCGVGRCVGLGWCVLGWVGGVCFLLFYLVVCAWCGGVVGWVRGACRVGWVAGRLWLPSFLSDRLPVVPVGLWIYGLGFAFTRGVLKVSLRCTFASQQVTLAAWARRASLRSNGMDDSMLSSTVP